MHQSLEEPPDANTPKPPLRGHQDHRFRTFCEGYDARGALKPRTPPYGKLKTPDARTLWLSGWDAADARIREEEDSVKELHADLDGRGF
jgi:ribosome modulation factor